MPPRSKLTKDAVSFDMLINKPMRKRTYILESGDDKIELVFQAIGALRWEELISLYPAPKDQKIEPGEGPTPWNKETFPAALIAECSLQPQLTYDQALAIWNSDNFALGEKRDLFGVCIAICQEGLDVPLPKPTED